MTRVDPGTLALYVVTADRAIVDAALEGGATAVQLRAPDLSDDELTPLARSLASRCATAGVPLIVNDRVDVAVVSGAAGAHVGQRDQPATARRRLGPDGILGISVGTVDEARAAEAADADYLGVTVWPTATKSDARPVGVDGLREVVAATALPVVGIGGIDAGNARLVLEAGAAGVAVSGAVVTAPDPVRAIHELAAAIGIASGRP